MNHIEMPPSQTPMDIADGIRNMLEKERIVICTLPDRRAMDLVIEHLSHADLKRVRFQFHK